MLVTEQIKSNLLNIFSLGEYKHFQDSAEKLLGIGFDDPWLLNSLEVSLAKQKKYNQSVD